MSFSFKCSAQKELRNIQLVWNFELDRFLKAENTQEILNTLPQGLFTLSLHYTFRKREGFAFVPNKIISKFFLQRFFSSPLKYSIACACIKSIEEVFWQCSKASRLLVCLAWDYFCPDQRWQWQQRKPWASNIWNKQSKKLHKNEGEIFVALLNGPYQKPINCPYLLIWNGGRICMDKQRFHFFIFTIKSTNKRLLEAIYQSDLCQKLRLWPYKPKPGEWDTPIGKGRQCLSENLN